MPLSSQSSHKFREAIIKAMVDTQVTPKEVYDVLIHVVKSIILQDGPKLRVAIERVDGFARDLKEEVREKHHSMSRLCK